VSESAVLLCSIEPMGQNLSGPALLGTNIHYLKIDINKVLYPIEYNGIVRSLICKRNALNRGVLEIHAPN
jgi:hypothetical protein